MVSIKWCAKKEHGLRMVAPNSTMADSYLRMAEESLHILSGVAESRIWTATTVYYIFYYALYSLMLRIGLRCEIHSCSIEVMRRYFMGFYDATDLKMIEKAFSARNDLQYYTDRPVDDQTISAIKAHCKDFFIKTKDIHSHIQETQVTNIRAVVRTEIKAEA